MDVKKEEDGYRIFTDTNTIHAKYVIMASRYPIINAPGFYFLKMYQQTSYLIAGEVTEELFSGMYINSEKPTISFRTAKQGNSRLLIVGGLDHKTGTNETIRDRYKELENIVKKQYPSFKRKYQWSAEDCISVDKIPYIGEYSSVMPNMYVATGYKKWGMTFCYLAAKIITDKIMKKENEYEEIFTSTRFEPIKNKEEVKNMLKEVTYSLAIKRLAIPEETLKEVKVGEGKIIEWEGKKVGVYCDERKELHMIEPICAHLGCELSFNSVEKTWDCPCHGSRYSYDGILIESPSVKDVHKL
mgnify:CR=1 FL=1